MYLINGEGDGETFYNRPVPGTFHYRLQGMYAIVSVSLSLSPFPYLFKKTTGDSSAHSQPVIELRYHLRNNHKAHVSRIHVEVYIEFKAEKITLDLGM